MTKEEGDWIGDIQDAEPGDREQKKWVEGSLLIVALPRIRESEQQAKDHAGTNPTKGSESANAHP